MTNQPINQQANPATYVATDAVTRDAVTEQVQIVTLGQVTNATTIVEAAVAAWNASSNGLQALTSDDVWHRAPKVIDIFAQPSQQPGQNDAALDLANPNATSPDGTTNAEWSYAIPAGRRAVILSAYYRIYRDGVAIAPGFVGLELGYYQYNSTVMYKQDGATKQAGVNFLGKVALYPCHNALYDSAEHELKQPVWLPVGLAGGVNVAPTVFINWFDSSYGGTTGLDLNVLILEFDA